MLLLLLHLQVLFVLTGPRVNNGIREFPAYSSLVAVTQGKGGGVSVAFCAVLKLCS